MGKESVTDRPRPEKRYCGKKVGKNRVISRKNGNSEERPQLKRQEWRKVKQRLISHKNGN